jgi:hypothetical protein
MKETEHELTKMYRYIKNPALKTFLTTGLILKSGTRN